MRPSFKRCSCASSLETAAVFSLLAARAAAALARFIMRCCSVIFVSKPVTLSLDASPSSCSLVKAPCT
eukprot:4159490-Pleurochrysis_carterae.AAC.1